MKQMSRIKALGIIVLACLLLSPGFYFLTKNNHTIDVYLDGVRIGCTKSEEEAKEAFILAKHEQNANKTSLTLVDAELTFEQSSERTQSIDTKEELEEAMKEELIQKEAESRKLAYTVKINDFTVTLASKEAVVEVLDQAQSQYNHSDNFAVELVKDPADSTGALTTDMVKASKSGRESHLLAASVSTQNDNDTSKRTTEKKTAVKGDDVVNVEFAEEIKVQETFVDASEVTSVEEAVSDITKDKAKKETYEVQSGDTISGIADKNGMKIKELLSMNKGLKDDTPIFPGEKLVISVPKSELSVLVEKEKTYKQKYKAKTVYVDNSNMYEGEKKVVRKGKAGVREVTALIRYNNGDSYDEKIVSKEIVKKAVPAKVERGTKVRPTFIKPISGGRFSSGFGSRWGRQHKGIDWATPIGTAVNSSADGTVVSAGWMNGYGYCVTVKHSDGKQTRYGHLSKVLVSAGQKVSQGDKIALSGNTGRSTGPHVHFEIIVGGTQVNPFDYLN